MYLNTIQPDLNVGDSAPQNGRERRRWNAVSEQPLDVGVGPYSKLPALTSDDVKELKLAIGRSGWNINLQRAAYVLIDVAANTVRGQRFQVPVRTLGDALGVSPASASRYMKQLRQKGLLVMFRRHQIHFDEGTGEYWGEAAVNQISARFLADVHKEGETAGHSDF